MKHSTLSMLRSSFWIPSRHSLWQKRHCLKLFVQMSLFLRNSPTFKWVSAKVYIQVGESFYTGLQLCGETSHTRSKCKNWETEEEFLPSGYQAPKLKLCLITLTRLNLINGKIFTILHHCCYVYLLHIPAYIIILIFIKSHCILSCTFYFIAYLILPYFWFFSPILMYILLCCVTYFALSIERTWPDLYFTTDYILYNWVCDE